VTVALSMIVRDAANTLAQCLESVRGVLQEIVIADTGSQDSTREIARSFGACVIQIPWHNDFAEARNRCLDEIRSSWVLSLDADEMLAADAARKLGRLISDPSIAGYQVTIRNFVLSLQDRIWDKSAFPNNDALPAGKKYPAYVDHQNVRLFRNGKDIRFVGRVHESVGPCLLQQKRRMAHADFLIYHFGLAIPDEERAAKNISYRQLGRQKLGELPNDAQAHLELGILEMDNFANLDEALLLFSRACELDPRLGPAWFFKGLVLLRKEKFESALECLRHAENLGHRTSLVAETQADVFYNLGLFPESVANYKIALQRDPANPWLTSKLGLALVRNGQRSVGLHHLNAAIDRRPEAVELYDRKMFAHFSMGRFSDAAFTQEAKLAQLPQPAASDFLRAASLWCKAGNSPRASLLLDRGVQQFPEDKKLLTAREELSSQTLILRHS